MKQNDVIERLFERQRISRRSTLLLASAATLSLGMPSLLRGKMFSLKVNYYNDFAPLSFVTPEGNVTGIFKDCLEEILHRRSGIALTHEGLPWVRAQQAVKEGKADAFCTLPSEARREYADFTSPPVFKVGVVIVFAKNSPKIDLIKKITKQDDLKQFSVGTYVGDSRINTLFKDIKLDFAPEMNQVVKKIEAGRVDITISNDVVWKYYARLSSIRDKLDSIPFEANAGPHFHLGIRKSYPGAAEILEMCDKAAADARKDGTIERITASYG